MTTIAPTTAREIVREDIITGKVHIAIPAATKSGTELTRLTAHVESLLDPAADASIITFEAWKNDGEVVPSAGDTITSHIVYEKVTNLQNGNVFVNVKAKSLSIG